MNRKIPFWLNKKLPTSGLFLSTKDHLNGINTVCLEADCPNRIDCFSKKQATFLLLGNNCSRNCSFCNIGKKELLLAHPDDKEISKMIEAIKFLKLKHVVLTMVTRDDLSDGGASHIAKAIDSVKELDKTITIEVLTSDFDGKKNSLDIVLEKNVEIFNHNVETVKELTSKIRDKKSSFKKSLSVLEYARKSIGCSVTKSSATFIKSGFMLGFGETKAQVKETIKELFEVGCDIITIGQYLKPSSKNVEVKEFLSIETFKEYEAFALSLGVKWVFSSPFVRSSFLAKEVFAKIAEKNR